MYLVVTWLAADGLRELQAATHLSTHEQRLAGVCEGVESLLNQVGHLRGPVVLDPGEDGGGCSGQAGGGDLVPAGGRGSHWLGRGPAREKCRLPR
jgi:hypothetical protein